MIEKVQKFIEKNRLINPKSTVVVGLSGGPDSICLLHILKQLQSKFNFELIAAHLDHQWREESTEDARFCKEYAGKLGVTFVEGKAEDIKTLKKYNGSKEEAGRMLRRAFLEAVARKQNADAIALGHHSDDQQETFFLRLIRGASIAGLAGMKPLERAGEICYVRPLLEMSKQEIFEYLRACGLAYVHDETNESQEFLRNAIRLKVLPALKECDDRFNKTFEKTHAHIQETEEFLKRVTESNFDEISVSVDGARAISLENFFKIDAFLQHRLLLRWLCDEGVPFTPSTAFFDEMIRFLRNKGMEHEIDKRWCIVKKDGRALIKKQENL